MEVNAKMKNGEKAITKYVNKMAAVATSLSSLFLLVLVLLVKVRAEF